VWQIVRDLVADGVTVFLTTQYLEEADQLADQIAVLDDGKLVAQGTPAQLKRQIPGGHITLEFPDTDHLDRAGAVLGATTHDAEALTLQIPSDGGVQSLRALLDQLDRAALEPTGLTVHTPDLDDVFLALTDKK
jgi:ABC-2 type transport system ATP-binding protein